MVIDKIMVLMDIRGINNFYINGYTKFDIYNELILESSSRKDGLKVYILQTLIDENLSMEEFITYRKAYLRNKKLKQLGI